MKNLINSLNHDALRDAYHLARVLDTDLNIVGDISVSIVPDAKDAVYPLLKHIKELADSKDWYALFELANEIESRFDNSDDPAAFASAA